MHSLLECFDRTPRDNEVTSRCRPQAEGVRRAGTPDFGASFGNAAHFFCSTRRPRRVFYPLTSQEIPKSFTAIIGRFPATIRPTKQSESSPPTLRHWERFSRPSPKYLFTEGIATRIVGDGGASAFGVFCRSRDVDHRNTDARFTRKIRNYGDKKLRWKLEIRLNLGECIWR